MGLFDAGIGAFGGITGASYLGGKAAGPGAIAGGMFGGIPGAFAGSKIPEWMSKQPGNSFPDYNFNYQQNPEISALQRRLESMPGAKPVDYTPETNAYQAKDYSKTNLPEYDYARQKATESINQSTGANQDAMARRFASMGGLNTGAYIKQAGITDQQAAEQKANALQGIGAEEAQAKRGLQQAEENKVFQSSEAMKGRNAQLGQQTKLFNADQDFKDKVFRFDSSTKLAQLDLTDREFQRQSAQDAYQNELNRYAQQHSGGILGSGGFLGSGIGPGMGGMTGFGI